MASAAERVSRLAHEGVEGLLSTAALRAELDKPGGVEFTLCELRYLHRQGLGYDDARPYLFPPLAEFLTSLGSVDRRVGFVGVSASGTWSLVKAEGWALSHCRSCERWGPLRSENYRRHGRHAQARCEEGVVWVRCGCSRLLGRLNVSLIPQGDRERLAGAS